MMEAEWLNSDDIEAMLAHLNGQGSERKARLFAVACCRRLRDLVVALRTEIAIGFAEEFADGFATVEELKEGYIGGWAANDTLVDFIYSENRMSDPKLFAMTKCAAACAQTAAGTEVFTGDRIELAVLASTAASARATKKAGQDWGPAFDEARRVEAAAQAVLLRDIFGNPFRAVSLNSEWRTPDILAFAEGIYSENRFQEVEILATMLENAGCTNKDILSHCRGPGPHVRGCFLIDLLLNKK